MSILSKNKALEAIFTKHIDEVCKYENLSKDFILAEMEAGRMVFLANPSHKNVKPIVIGQPSRIKVNANIGTSPLCNCVQTELKKLQVAIDAGTDTVMDLSIAGDLDEIRREMLNRCVLPLGTVPMYAVGQKYLDEDIDPCTINPDEIFQEIAKQAEQGVDYMTVHCGLTRQGAKYATDGSRQMGIVSRGGSMLARWMLKNDKENPLLTDFDRIVDIAVKHNVVLSLGDGLRPGAGADAGDAAQFEEVIALGQLAKHALSRGVQCMIEGPGHVRLNEVEAQIITIKKLTNGAPLYVLGPLTTDVSPGYDHISGAIGGALGVRAGVDFLCYLTPAEHLTLPDASDVKDGVIASRIAAQVGEVALNRAHAVAREALMSKARLELNWEDMRNAALDPVAVEERREPHKDEEACAMCGKFCAVKMLQD